MKLIAILILILTFQTPSQADDISDFKMEGMSIGDSLLDYFSKKDIEDNSVFMFEKNKYKTALVVSKSHPKSNYLLSANFEVYDQLAIYYLYKDNDYKISSFDGSIYFKDNIKNCYKEKDKTTSELTELFGESATIKDEGFTKKKNFKYNAVNFIFDEGSSARVTCRDYKKKIKNKIDQLSVILKSIEYRKWFNEEAYK